MAQGSTKGIPIDTDSTFGSATDLLVPSTLAVKTYVATGMYTVLSASYAINAGSANTATTASYVSILAGPNIVVSYQPGGIAISGSISGGTYTSSIGNGSATNIGVTHNLNTRDVIVQVYDNATYETVLCDVIRTNPNFVTCSFTVAPTTNQYRVVIKS